MKILWYVNYCVQKKKNQHEENLKKAKVEIDRKLYI